jgi:hypothetical protein
MQWRLKKAKMKDFLKEIIREFSYRESAYTGRILQYLKKNTCLSVCMKYLGHDFQ